MYLGETEDRIFGIQNPETMSNRHLSPMEMGRFRTLLDAEQILDQCSQTRRDNSLTPDAKVLTDARMEQFFKPVEDAAPKPSTINRATTMSGDVIDANIAQIEASERFDLSGVESALTAEQTRAWLEGLRSA